MTVKELNILRECFQNVESDKNIKSDDVTAEIYKSNVTLLFVYARNLTTREEHQANIKKYEQIHSVEKLNEATEDYICLITSIKTKLDKYTNDDNLIDLSKLDNEIKCEICDLVANWQYFTYLIYFSPAYGRYTKTVHQIENLTGMHYLEELAIKIMFEPVEPVKDEEETSEEECEDVDF